MAEFDIAILGGGINGTAIARDAAGRGLRVLLVEQSDLAAGTSSASSKIVHGGLRYLRYGAFRLVREALGEREILLCMAPHIVRPLRFVLPPAGGLIEALVLRTGLFLYDRLAARDILPATRTIDLRHDIAGRPLKDTFRYGFEYSDCSVDDARFVVLNALDAKEKGADILTRTRCVRAERGSGWRLLLDNRGGQETASARVLVNATGPWIASVAENVLGVPLSAAARLVKGSHIVVPRHVGHDRAYTLQAPDGRVVFALPFSRDFTLIGTTDEEFSGDTGAPAPDADEIAYLCKAVNAYLRQPVAPEDVVWEYAGIRSLHDDGSKKPEDVTRDYTLTLDEGADAPVLTVYGGKITTARRLAEVALDRLAHVLRPAPAWTASSHLPGGDFAPDGFDAAVAQARSRWRFLDAAQAERLFRAYGTRLDRILGDAASAEDLGPSLGGGLTGAEVRYLMQAEWAKTPDDVLWRRTKCGLRASANDVEALTRFMAQS
jgi:glycerol-3-phosphate dehydrogenase